MVGAQSGTYAPRRDVLASTAHRGHAAATPTGEPQGSMEAARRRCAAVESALLASVTLLLPQDAPPWAPRDLGAALAAQLVAGPVLTPRWLAHAVPAHRSRRWPLRWAHPSARLLRLPGAPRQRSQSTCIRGEPARAPQAGTTLQLGPPCRASRCRQSTSTGPGQHPRSSRAPAICRQRRTVHAHLPTYRKPR
jgi:hypothetical protein